MHIGIMGIGDVAKSFINVINKDDHVLYAYARNPKMVNNVIFNKISSDAQSIVESQSVNTIIDLLGHSDEAVEVSREIIEKSLENGKNVITSNKKLMKRYGKELCDYANKSKGSLYINSLTSSSDNFDAFPVYLSTNNFNEINEKYNIFSYRGAGPEEVALSINQEIKRIGSNK
jgi:homoserine dehydrogenase